jgi:hypothetical protein
MLHQAITLGAVLAAIAVLVGLALCGLAALAVFAAGMSDNPEAGNDASRTGCIIGIAGIVLAGLGLWGLLS